MKSMGCKGYRNLGEFKRVRIAQTGQIAYLTIGKVGELLDENLVHVFELLEDDEEPRTDEETVGPATIDGVTVVRVIIDFRIFL